ncbi:MAG: ABC transporter permease [Thermomicrobiales bacterium]|nr:ABC transporter permease [Thermomicrobiales bacterium]
MDVGVEKLAVLEEGRLPASPDKHSRKRRLSPTASYILRRIGLFLITLWGSLTAAFFFFRLLPGDPIRAYVGQLQQRGTTTTFETNEAMLAYYQKEFGLDGSLLHQYFSYFRRLLIDFDLGPSVLSYPTPAIDLIMRALPWTIGLIGVATLLGWILGMILGTLTGWNRNRTWAEVVTNGALGFSHLPAYFVALFLIIFLSYRWKLLPPNGAFNTALDPEWSMEFVLSVIKYGTLPVLATVIVAVANWMLSTRALVVSILGEDYLTFAGAKGLPARRILSAYVLRNAWLPQIAALGMALGGVVSGNVLIERLFRYPGVGSLLIDAVLIKDVNTAMAIVSILIILVLTINLIIDLTLPLIDPRVKLTGAGG